MAGLAGTGLGYQKTALSGMIRLSAEEEQQKEAEKQLEAAESAQKTQMVMGGLGLAISTACLIAELFA